MGLPLENARYQFNLMGFDERVAGGELEIVILLMDWPRSDVEELRQTESQIVLYVSRDDGEALAECLDTSSSAATSEVSSPRARGPIPNGCSSKTKSGMCPIPISWQSPAWIRSP